MGAGHGHSHPEKDESGRRLATVLALVSCYMVAEVIGGLLANSLALLADAGHMFSDAGALVVSLVALRIAARAPTATHTFGYRRTEILAALFNGAVLVGVAVYIVIEAIQRLGDPPVVAGGTMLAVASGGLVVNLISLLLLHQGKSENLNVRGAWLHVAADALGSVGAMVSGLLVATLGWYWADPAASVIIATLVVYSAWSLIRDTLRVLMQAVPDHIDLEVLEAELLAISGVVTIHDLHVWSVTRGRDVLSAHVDVTETADRAQVMSDISRVLRERFDLYHSTIQIDCPPDCYECP